MKLTILVVVIALGTSATAQAFAQELVLVERATTDATTHVGPKADNLGDLLTFANPVYDAANKMKVGTDQGYCIRVVLGKSYECFWTLIMPNGQITVEGPFADAGDTKLAVTGGTGAFADVRGELALHARDAKGTEYDFKYSLKYSGSP